jgi:hypothetical protein
MKIKLYPVKIEAYNDDESVFKVESFDSETCNVEIDVLVDVESWDELSPHVRNALSIALQGIESVSPKVKK